MFQGKPGSGVKIKGYSGAKEQGVKIKVMHKKVQQ
jgi:hypothetical protein